MMEEKILKHYRYGGKLTHIGCEVLPNMQPINVQIEHIEWLNNVMVNGQKKDAWVASFTGNPFGMGMILNSTNRKRLARLFNTPYLETLNNVWVTLQAEDTRDPVDGGTIKGLRIAPKLPKMEVVKEKMDVDHPRFEGAKKAIMAKSITLDAIAQQFDLTKKALTELKQVSNG